ncbi:MAG: hypothetical protein HQK84_02060 [Nitrospinae bacterium]|nr:hypothetical protein [Nitrospinota bacterium]
MSGYYMKFKSLFFTTLFLFQTFISSAQQVPNKDDVLPHDIRADVEIGFRFWTELMVGIILLLLILLGYFLYKKKKAKEGGNLQPTVPSRPIEELLKEELNNLAQAQLDSDEKIKGFYFNLSEVSRKILELEGVGTVEQTFDEFKPHLSKTSVYPENINKQILFFLERSELIKFAKSKPEPSHIHDDLNLCFHQLELFEEKIKVDQ